MKEHFFGCATQPYTTWRFMHAYFFRILTRLYNRIWSGCFSVCIKLAHSERGRGPAAGEAPEHARRGLIFCPGRHGHQDHNQES